MPEPRPASARGGLPVHVADEGAVSSAAAPISGVTERWTCEMLDVFCPDVSLLCYKTRIFLFRLFFPVIPTKMDNGSCK